MAAAYVSSVAAAAWAGGSPVSTTITVSSVTDSVLFAFVGWGGTGDITTVSSADGNFSTVPNTHVSSATDRTIGSAWYYITNPSTGSTNVGAAFSGSINVAHIAVVQFSGAHQTTPYGDVSTVIQSTSPFVFAVSSAAGDPMLSAAVNSAPGALNLTDITDGTLRWEVNETAFWGTTSIGGTKDGEATSTQMTYTLRTDNGGPVSGFTVLTSAEKSAAVTGTATATITEADIVTGGKTVIVTLSSETYVANSTIPVSFTASATLESGNNTASTLWFVSTQGVSTNDLVIWHIGWDDSTNVTAVTASTAPSGQNISTLMGPVASINTEVRSQIYWAIATTSWAASTTAFTPSASESWTAVVLRIPAGSFNSSSPFGSKSTYNANTSTGTAVSSPSFSCTTSDAIGRLVAFNTIDTDPITGVPAGWVSTDALDLGAVTHGLSYRTSTVAASESIASESWTIAGDSSVTHSYILKAYAVNSFDDARQAFINGCDSAQSEANGWDAVVKAGQHVSTVVRTSDTVVTMTLSAYASYNITAQETVTVSVPGSILTGGVAILAAPTFTIDTTGGGGGTFFMHDKLLLLGVS